MVEAEAEARRTSDATKTKRNQRLYVPQESIQIADSLSPLTEIMIKKPKAQITKVEAKILNALQRNSRLSIRKLSVELGLSEETISAKIKRLEKAGFIQQYSAIVDYEKMGYSLTVVLFMQTVWGHGKELVELLSQMGNVQAAYEITEDYNVMAIVKVKNRENLNMLLQNVMMLPFVKKTMIDIATNIVKDDFRLKVENK